MAYREYSITIIVEHDGEDGAPDWPAIEADKVSKEVDDLVDWLRDQAARAAERFYRVDTRMILR